MSRRLVLATSLTTALLAARAGAEIEIGKDAPPVTTGDWFNHAAVSPTSLRGQVVALLFVRLAEDDSLFFFETWDGLRGEFAERPVTFLAVTNEAPAVLQENIQIEKLTAPMATNPTDDAAVGFGVQTFPSVAVIDGAGRVRYVGAAADAKAIRDAIHECLPTARFHPPLPKSMKALERHFEKWDLGKAHAALVAMRAKKGDADTERLAADLPVLLEVLTRRMRAAADAAIAAEDWPRAVTILERLAAENAGIAGSEGAAAVIDELAAREGLAEEIDAARMFAKAERLERDANWKRAQGGYDALIKRYPETKAGKLAVDRAEFAASKAG